MKKTENYTFNHFNKTIIMTKKFSKAASIMGTVEFKELMGLMKEFPTYTLEVREISKPEKKKETYKGLSVKRMREFITWRYREDTETQKKMLDEFDSRVKFYEDFHKVEKASAMKTWFLGIHKDAYLKWEKATEKATEKEKTTEKAA